MANIKHLEKDYKEILLGLTAEEVTEYYKQLNKKIVNCYPTLNTNWNEEELDFLLASVEDVTSVLKKNYTKASLDRTNLSSRYIELDSKYVTEIDLAFTKLSYSKLLNIAYNIGSVLKNLYFFLICLYNGYTYLKDEKTIKESVDLNSFEASVYIRYINNFIKMEVEEIEANIKLFEDRFSEIDSTGLTDVPEVVVNAISKYNELYSKCSSTIEEYEELKLNPFKKAIEFDVLATIETYSKYTEEDYSDLLIFLTASAPSYNFETFEFIVPEGVVE